MAHVLVLQGHASSNSFTQALGREFMRALRDAHHTVLELHAYETDLPFADPTRLHHRGETTYPEVKEFVLRADALVFVFPVWFGGPPAAMKNVLDHFDFAYTYSEGKLTSHLRATAGYIIRTSDAPAGWPKATAEAAVKSIMEPFRALGVKRWGQFPVEKLTQSSLDQRKLWLGRIFTEGQKFARSL